MEGAPFILYPADIDIYNNVFYDARPKVIRFNPGDIIPWGFPGNPKPPYFVPSTERQRFPKERCKLDVTGVIPYVGALALWAAWCGLCWALAVMR